MPRVLFIASHRPDRSPSQRFRYEQYMEYLKENGFEYDYSWLISEKDDLIFYSPGNIFSKFFIFLKSVWKRSKDVLRRNRYDIIFIQREAFMTGSVFFEKMLARSKAKLIFDYDDAIWKHDVSDANRKLGWLKNPAKTSRIIALADLVIAGNQYLADYASQWCRNVVVIPTTLDTDLFKPCIKQNNSSAICIGWSGSSTTTKYLKEARNVLLALKHKFGDQVYFKVIGDAEFIDEDLGIQGLAWKRAREIDELCEIDIGLMPLPDDEWTRGKCGFKALLYMSLGIPSVISPVGVNSEIIRDGENGFLAGTENEWINKISKLILDKELRLSLGMAGRDTVVNRYSVTSQKDVYLRAFKEIIKNK